MIRIATALLFVMQMTVAQLVENLEPGIHIEDIGMMFRVEERAEIVYNIDLTSSEFEVKNLGKIREQILRSCKSDSRNCFLLENMMHSRMNDIDKKLKGFNLHRTKRGLIDAGGNILRYIFGTLDSEDRKRINRKFEQIATQEKSADQNMIKIGELMESTIKTFNEEMSTCMGNGSTLRKIAENFNRIEKSQNALEKQIQLDRFIYELWFSYDFLSGKVINFMENVRATIEEISNGIFASQILPFDLVWNDAKSIATNAKNRIVPFDSQPNMEEFKATVRYGVLQSKTGYSVIFTIPVVNTDEYHVFHMRSIPKILDGVATGKKIDTSWLLSDKSLTKLIRTSESEMAKMCTEVRRKFYCFASLAWSSEKSCELSALNGREAEVEELCETIVYSIPTSVIIKTQHENKLIVLSNGPKKAKFVGVETKNLRLNLASLITIESAGKLYIDGKEIDFPNRDHVHVMSKQIRMEKILEIKLENLTISDANHLIPLMGNGILDQEKINNLAIRWQDLAKQMKEEKDGRSYGIYWILGAATPMILLGIAMAVKLWKRKSTTDGPATTQPEEDQQPAEAAH